VSALRTELVDAGGEDLAVLAAGGALVLRPDTADPDVDDLLVVDDPAALAELAVAVATALEQRAVAIAAGHPVTRGLAAGPDVGTRAADAARRLGYAREALARI
jgi:hypothetical protein